MYKKVGAKNIYSYLLSFVQRKAGRVHTSLIKVIPIGDRG